MSGSNDEVQIRHFKKLSGTPAVSIIVKGWASLIDEGLCGDGIFLAWDHNAFVAFVDGKPVGFLSYSEQDWCSEYHICLGYVIPEHRKRGVYSMLWERLVTEARLNKIRKIGSSTALTNDVLRRLSAKQGRKEVSVNLTFDVGDS